MIDPINQAAFNDEIDNIISNCADLGCEQFNGCVVKDASKIVCESKVNHKGWFEDITDILIPILDERKRILMLAKSIQEMDESARRMCNDATNKIKDIMSFAKGRWVISLV